MWGISLSGQAITRRCISSACCTSLPGRKLNLSWTPNGDGMLWVLISHKQALHFKAKTSAGAVSPLFLCGRSRTNAIRSIGRWTFEDGLSLREIDTEIWPAWCYQKRRTAHPHRRRARLAVTYDHRYRDYATKESSVGRDQSSLEWDQAYGRPLRKW